MAKYDMQDTRETFYIMDMIYVLKALKRINEPYRSKNYYALIEAENRNK